MEPKTSSVTYSLARYSSFNSDDQRHFLQGFIFALGVQSSRDAYPWSTSSALSPFDVEVSLSNLKGPSRPYLWLLVPKNAPKSYCKEYLDP